MGPCYQRRPSVRIAGSRNPPAGNRRNCLRTDAWGAGTEPQAALLLLFAVFWAACWFVMVAG